MLASIGLGDSVGFFIKLRIVFDVRLTIFKSGFICWEFSALLMLLVGRKIGLGLGGVGVLTGLLFGVRAELNILCAFFLAWSIKCSGYLSSLRDSRMNDSSLGRNVSLQILRALRYVPMIMPVFIWLLCWEWKLIKSILKVGLR